MNNLIILLFIFVASSCERKSDSDQLVYYRCSVAQLEIVKKENMECKVSGYLDSFCFRQAKMSQCDYVGPKKISGIGGTEGV